MVIGCARLFIFSGSLFCVRGYLKNMRVRWGWLMVRVAFSAGFGRTWLFEFFGGHFEVVEH